MKKNIFTFVSLFVMGMATLMAAPVDTALVRQAAGNFLTQRDGVRQAAPMQLAYQLDGSTQQPCVYVYNRVGGGYVVMAADDQVRPVLGYSLDGAFDAATAPANLLAWLESYRTAVEDLSAGTRAYPSMAAAWQALLEGTAPAGSRDVVVEPLLVTTWNQSPYYNRLCPGSGSNKAITGCVATAMGQIMRYWQWPAQGNGQHSYVANYSDYGYGDYGTLEVDYSAATYDYTLMPALLNSSTPIDQVNEVAKLLYHCGVSVNMMYSPSASGANSENVPNAMRRYFGYGPSTFNYKGSNETAWINALKGELNAERPVYYSGSGDDGGHAFVCDGYDEDNFFHFNWGWQGSHNGYFAVSDLNPGSYVFNTYQGGIFGLEPDPCYPYPEIAISGNTVMADENSSVTLTAPAGASYAWSTGEHTQSITVAPSVPKYYTVTVTDEGGCANTASTWVTFADGCEITFHLHDSYGDGWQGCHIKVFNRVVKIAEVTLEEGADIDITLPVVSGELALKWHNGNYPEETSFEVSGHCLELAYPEAPQTSVFLITELYCGDIVTEFDATADGSGYEWNGNTYTESGDYTQVFTNQAGCDSTVTMHLTITAGVNDNTAGDVRISPNPTSGTSLLTVPAATAPTEARCYDAYGKLLFIQKIEEETTAIDLSAMSAGVYFLRLYRDGALLVTKKVVKE